MGRTKTNRGTTAKNLTFKNDIESKTFILRNTKELKFIKKFVR